MTQPRLLFLRWLAASAAGAAMSLLPVLAQADTKVSDTWSVIPKGLGGIFTDSAGNWTEYEMTDTDASGRQYIELWLVPGSQVEFKGILNPKGTRTYESDFKNASSTGRRTLVVPTNGGTVEMNWSDTPSPPTGLKAYSDTGQVTLTWTAAAGDSNADVRSGGGYYIYYDTGPVFDTWLLLRNDTIYAATTTCTSLTNDSIYYFSLRSFDAYLDTGPRVSGGYSESAQVTPGKAAQVQFRIFVGDIIDSEVFIGFDTGVGWTERKLAKEGATNWWSDTLSLNRGLDFTYKFVVKDTAAVKTYEFPAGGGRSHMFIYPHKSTASAVSVKGSWNWGVSNAMRKDADGYWRKDVSIPNGGVFEYGFTVNVNTWDTDPENSVTRNGNSVGGIDATRDVLGIRRFKVPETDAVTVVSSNWEDTPYVPTDLKAMSNPNNSILLTWTAASQTEDLDSYRIEYTEAPADSTTWVTLAVVNEDSTTFLHQNVIPTDTYYYRLYAIDDAGETSGWKNYASATASLQKEVLFLIENAPKKPAGVIRRMEVVRKDTRRLK